MNIAVKAAERILKHVPRSFYLVETGEIIDTKTLVVLGKLDTTRNPNFTGKHFHRYNFTTHLASVEATYTIVYHTNSRRYMKKRIDSGKIFRRVQKHLDYAAAEKAEISEARLAC